MTRRQLAGSVCAALVLLNPSARVMVQADTKQSIEDIRKELLQLPYYSVFDFLAFSYQTAAPSSLVGTPTRLA